MKKILTVMSIAACMLAVPAARAEEPAPESAPKGEHHQPPHKGGMLEEDDANSDKMISKEEFLAVHEKRFAEIDSNSDGQISPEELEARRQEWQEKMKEKITEARKRKAGGKPPEAPAEKKAE